MSRPLSIISHVTRNLPVSSIPFDSAWKHLRDLHLADPNFETPGAIDLLLRVDIFIAALRKGWRSGPPELPTALETEFGWVLAGNICPLSSSADLISHHVNIFAVPPLYQGPPLSFT